MWVVRRFEAGVLAAVFTRLEVDRTDRRRTVDCLGTRHWVMGGISELDAKGRLGGR
jgi:hypothetical protein